jgi:hypothetical protein
MSWDHDPHEKPFEKWIYIPLALLIMIAPAAWHAWRIYG